MHVEEGMVTALIVTAVLSCKPYHPPVPPPETTLACEGADQVRRRTADGAEIGRWHNASTCTRAVCEGADFVRRDVAGLQLERWSNASVCPAPRPQPVRLTSDPKPLQFGLTSR